MLSACTNDVAAPAANNVVETTVIDEPDMSNVVDNSAGNESMNASDRGSDDRGSDDRGSDDRGSDDRGSDDRGSDDR
jgi:hypothetical protein